MPELSLRQFLRWNGFDSTVGIRRLLREKAGGNLRRLLDVSIQDLDSIQPNQPDPVNDQQPPNIWQAFKAPTFTYKEEGYSYDELTEEWKEMCNVLPCFDALKWPDYSTTHIEVDLMGLPVVIQIWKGWCQRFLGLPSFPGGIGAEVGIYQRDPGRKLPDSLPLLTEGGRDFILKTIETLSDSEIWWPVTDPEFISNLEIEFELINPKTEDVFFSAGPERNTYWLAKWMTELSYLKYQFLKPTPFLSIDYIFNLKINGKEYYRW